MIRAETGMQLYRLNKREAPSLLRKNQWTGKGPGLADEVKQ